MLQLMRQDAIDDPVCRWVLFITHLHIKVNISTKYHEDTTISYYYKLWPGQGINNTILDLLSQSVMLTLYIDSWVLFGKHVHIILNISISLFLPGQGINNLNLTFDLLM